MLADRLEKYRWLETDRQSKLIVYVTGDRRGMGTGIATDSIDYFEKQLDQIGVVNKISLMLYTQGGDTMAAYALVNLIRQFCEEFEIIIPSKARSSGTIICLGADSIIMTKQATLGPIDPSLHSDLNPQNPAHPNNPAARVPVSVESVQGFIDLAKEELGLRGEEHLKGILLSLSEKVHPLVLGNAYRSRSQIKMVARKLLNKQFGDSDTDKIEKIVTFLCSDSGSHDYAIHRREAKGELGLNIQKPNDEQYKVINEIYEDIREELKLLQPFNPKLELGTESTIDYNCRRLLIESIEGGTDLYISEGTLEKKTETINQTPPLPPIQRTIIDNSVKFEGWQHEEHDVDSGNSEDS